MYMKKIIIWSAFSFLFLLVGVYPVFASTAPSAPTGLTPTPGNTQVGLTWTAPADGGSAITDYKVEYQASNGVIYVANINNDTILKSTDGGASWTDTTNGGAFNSPTGITTDSLNNIYVTNYNNTILKSTDGGASWTNTTNGGVFISPRAITTDSLNNIYVTNFGNNTILKSTNGGASWTNTTNGGAFNFPTGITTDSSNTIYVVNASNNTILKSTNGGASWTNTTNGGAFNNPQGITTDSSNTIYVLNASNNTILKSTDGGASWTNTTNGGAFNNPYGITTDSANNIYVANINNDTILKSTDGGASWTDTTNGGAFSGPFGVGASKWLTFSDGTSTTASTTVTGLSNGTSYDFRISAINAVGTGLPSSAVSSTPVVASFTVTYTAGTGGTIIGTASQTINSGSDGTAVTAAPNSGYRFVSWSDASTNASRTDTNITADHTYAASFELIPVPRSSGGGSSVQSRVANLIAMGNKSTADDLKAKYPNLFPVESNNIKVITTGLPPRFQFKKDLKPKVTNDDIKTLQIFLNANGFIVAKSGAGSKGHETNYFGQKTKQALMKFQQTHVKDILTTLGLKGPTGILGQNSRKVINEWIEGEQR